MAFKLIQRASKGYIGTGAERAAMTTPEKAVLNVGDEFTETDTGLKYQWSGAAWFKLIFPAV